MNCTSTPAVNAHPDTTTSIIENCAFPACSGDEAQLRRPLWFIPGVLPGCIDGAGIVRVPDVSLWIDYQQSDAFPRCGQEQLFLSILKPLGLTYSGSGAWTGAGWADIDFDVPLGTNLHTVHAALDTVEGFEFIVELLLPETDGSGESGSGD